MKKYIKYDVTLQTLLPHYLRISAEEDDGLFQQAEWIRGKTCYNSLMQDQHQFILFENPKYRRGERAYITLQKDGGLFLSKAFCEKNNVFRFKDAKLFCDADKRAIAIVLVDTPIENGTFKVTPGKSSTAVIAIRTLLRANKLDPETYSGQYPVKKHTIQGEGEAFVIDLEERIGEKHNKQMN